MESKLFVGNLSYDSTEDSLREAFSKAGTVNDVRIMTDKFTGKSRGFGFIEMGSAEEAQAAIAMYDGQDVDGRALTVNVARPKRDDNGGF